MPRYTHDLLFLLMGVGRLYWLMKNVSKKPIPVRVFFFAAAGGPFIRRVTDSYQGIYELENLQ